MGPFCLGIFEENFLLCVPVMLGAGFVYETLARSLGGGM